MIIIKNKSLRSIYTSTIINYRREQKFFIYGYINGCYEATEYNQVPFTEDMWPDNVKNVCGCVVDAMRHALTYEEMLDNASHMQAVLIAQATLPMCVQQEYEEMMNKK